MMMIRKQNKIACVVCVFCAYSGLTADAGDESKCSFPCSSIVNCHSCSRWYVSCAFYYIVRGIDSIWHPTELHDRWYVPVQYIKGIFSCV